MKRKKNDGSHGKGVGVTDELQEQIAKLKAAEEKERVSRNSSVDTGELTSPLPGESGHSGTREPDNLTVSSLVAAKEAAEEKLMRVVAEMQNLKRRSEEDKRQFAAFANQSLLLDVLQIVQTFNLSVSHLPADLADNEWVKGVLSIDKQLNGFLERQGVKDIKCVVGDKVDPAKHEVMMKGEGDDGVVVEVFEKGYEMNGRVLKAAKVKAGGA
jgi:molecular chaperone GrpE